MKNLLKDQKGTTAIEYAVIASLISVIIIVSAGFVGTESKENFDTVANKLDTAFNPASGGSSDDSSE